MRVNECEWPYTSEAQFSQGIGGEYLQARALNCVTCLEHKWNNTEYQNRTLKTRRQKYRIVCGKISRIWLRLRWIRTFSLRKDRTGKNTGLVAWKAITWNLLCIAQNTGIKQATYRTSTKLSIVLAKDENFSTNPILKDSFFIQPNNSKHPS